MGERNITIIHKKDRESFIRVFNRHLDTHDDGYLLVLSPDDTFGDEKQGEKYEHRMAQKLADILDENEEAVLATPKRLFQFPDRITGVMLRVSMIDIRLREDLLYNYEADFLLRLAISHPILIQQDIEYVQGEPGDGNFHEFGGIYDKRWYIDNLKSYLIPLFKSFDEVPEPVQFFAMYNITCRLDANQNYNNRHVLNDTETDVFKDLIGEALQYVDEGIIMNVNRFPVYKRDFQFSRMLLRIKREYAGEAGDGFTLKRIDSPEEIPAESIERDFFHYNEIRLPAYVLLGKGRGGETFPVHSTSKLRCNIQLMDVKDGKLEIDGSVPDIYDKEKVSYFFEAGTKRYPVSFCERYSLTKYFGRSAYKRYPFHVSIPISGFEGGITFNMQAEGDEEPIRIVFEFKSHTSRLAAYPRNAYWHKGEFLFSTVSFDTESGGFLVSAIRVRKYSFGRMAIKEIKTGAELLFSFRMHRFRFFLLRAAWVVTRPYFKNKKIWLFFDKIYKGGDSAEYMFRYTLEQMKKASEGEDRDEAKAPDRAYYLLDETAPDYERMMSEGIRPLKRGSFLHRLIFLNADILVASNSTVFAFNDYYLENSRFIRGIPDFKVACVQHGLSVQKIALAQQRLRDNIRMYFIASRYEEENLMKPVYDYAGYDAIKLTGIPRYDGLINDDKKQILISPTWRMQSAKLVTRHEGLERDYNPDFKETAYYKIYNGLINDEKLIAAAKEYGYRIVYVLHPIVSPQVDDFVKNDFVDIIPATGDMSYERIFSESSLMVTDYSGIQFDFAYMRKPLVYYHPAELEAHYEEGTFHYDTMAFGEIVRKKDELVALLSEYMKNGCEMKELYRLRADDFFEYDDRENCKRVYDVLRSSYD